MRNCFFLTISFAPSLPPSHSTPFCSQGFFILLTGCFGEKRVRFFLFPFHLIIAENVVWHVTKQNVHFILLFSIRFEMKL